MNAFRSDLVELLAQL